MTQPLWCVMPVRVGKAMTLDALGDLLGQTIPTQVLVVLQGGDPDLRVVLEREASQQPDRVFLWTADPAFPSLSACWNRALRFVWETGASEALVVNNDVRLWPETAAQLQAVCVESKDAADRWQAAPLFVSAVGVEALPVTWQEDQIAPSRGGPDFSCYLITKDGHDAYPFDEGFAPAFCEDVDLHRRMLLNGDGDRIYSITLPYLHLGSQTLKQLPETQRAETERQIAEISRKHYEDKWGGPVNQERYTIPFELASIREHVTTPELFDGVREGWHVQG